MKKDVKVLIEHILECIKLINADYFLTTKFSRDSHKIDMKISLLNHN
ncbi:MAG: hypothetical protein KAS99_04015 [Candidatus Omnitrophica bacterium]|nr:hypothetical protein [Candidatus Omnitrophota bacterium]